MRIRTALVCAAAVCTALVGSAPAPAHAATTGATRPAQSPKQLAEADAASMLATFRSPPGAQRSGPIAVPALSSAPAGSVSPDFVTRTAWWRVPGPMDATLAWVAAHPPAGFTLGGGGSTSDASVIVSRFDQFTLPTVSGVLSERALYVSVARDGADATALRVDSQVSWLPQKSPDERIPAAAKVVTITALPGLGNGPVAPIRRVYTPVTVTDRATVTKIAAVVDGLQLMPPGVFSCPFSNGQGLRLTFRAALDAPILATVTADMNGCGTVVLDIGGKQMPVLWGGAQMAPRVLKLAGIHWAGF
jgi:hypothetical protein